MRIFHHRIVQRDVNDLPTADGLAATTSVVNPDVATATSLLLAGTGAATSAPTSVRVVPTVAAGAGSSTMTVSHATASATSMSASSSGPSIGTVIGACVGAFTGAAFVILTVLFFLRRWARQHKAHARTRSGPTPAARNLDGEHGRRRSRLEPWPKPGDANSAEKATPVPAQHSAKSPSGDSTDMEKMQMFKGTPSLRSNVTKTTAGNYFDLDPTMLAKYHAGLAEQYANDDVSSPQRPFAGERQESGVSWGGETAGASSFLTMRSTRMSGAMSPSFNAAKQTPDAQVLNVNLPQWESAVVVLPSHAADGQDPFADTQPAAGPSARAQADLARQQSRRRSVSNPFFSAQEREMDPFADAHVARARAMTQGHRPMQSDASTAPSEHAMQSLIAALAIPQEEIEARLRVASMDPSVASRYSVAYTASAYEEEGTIPDFPLPPATSEHSR
jgi:hypothetical protein